MICLVIIKLMNLKNVLMIIKFIEEEYKQDNKLKDIKI